MLKIIPVLDPKVQDKTLKGKKGELLKKVDRLLEIQERSRALLEEMRRAVFIKLIHENKGEKYLTAEFDRAMLTRLKSAYKKAVEEEKETFVFAATTCHQTLVVDYAKYLIQYLDEVLAKKND